MLLNNENTRVIKNKYDLSPFIMDDYTNEVLSMYGSKTTIQNLEDYIINKGHAPKKNNIVIYNQDDTVLGEDDCIDLQTIQVQLSDNVRLPSIEEVQSFWETTQVDIVVPTKKINTTKKPPISTMIATSIMSAKLGSVIDNSGKGARIMNVKRINKMYDKLIDIRKIKPSTINSHIRKLLKLKSKEFEFVTLENEQYYKLDYSDGFILVDLRIIHYMFTCYSDNMIQAYLVFLWNCRNGWSQLTYQQLAEHLGLTIHSERQAKIIIDKLVMDGFIEQKKSYRTIQVIDSFGVPSTINRKYFEYRVVDINEAIDKM